MILETSIHHDARGDILEPAIFPRVIRIGRAPQRWFHHALYLAGGAASMTANGIENMVQGPALAFMPPSPGETLSIKAGAHGYLLGMSPEVIGEAIGDHVESPSLRLFIAAPSLLGTLTTASSRAILPLFSGFVAELQRESEASRMVIAAYARLVIMGAWRLHGASDPVRHIRGGAAPILQRFRQSVEVSFRSHRTIANYAEELGISTDRLHAICQRTLSRSPIELVHERLLQEARLRLERSARTVQEISDSLGFRDPTHFSHFFKKKTGVSPARYRELARTNSGAESLALSSSYHDWP